MKKALIILLVLVIVAVLAWQLVTISQIGQDAARQVREQYLTDKANWSLTETHPAP